MWKAILILEFELQLEYLEPDIHIYTIQIGLALKKLFEEGVVKREDLFITSKLWYGKISSDSPVLMSVPVDHTGAYLKFLIIRA